MLYRLAVVSALLAACSADSSRLNLNDFTVVKSFTGAAGGTMWDVAIGDGVAYLSDLDGFRAYRLNHGDDAEELARYTVMPASGQSNQPLALRGTTLAVAHGSRIALVDVSDPANPRTLSTIDIGTSGAGRALAFDQDWLYWGGLNMQRANIADLAHPGTPAVVASNISPNRLLAADGVLYASGSGMLAIFQRPDPAITNPAAVPLGMLSLGDAGDLVRRGDHLYGSVGNGGAFWIADVHSAAAPSIVYAGAGLTGEPGSLVVNGDQLLAPTTSDITIDWDISDARAPKQIDAKVIARGYDHEANYAAAIDGELVVLANARGLVIVAPTL